MTAALTLAAVLIGTTGISLVIVNFILKPDPDTEHWPN